MRVQTVRVLVAPLDEMALPKLSAAFHSVGVKVTRPHNG